MFNFFANEEVIFRGGAWFRARLRDRADNYRLTVRRRSLSTWSTIVQLKPTSSRAAGGISKTIGSRTSSGATARMAVDRRTRRRADSSRRSSSSTGGITNG